MLLDAGKLPGDWNQGTQANECELGIFPEDGRLSSCQDAAPACSPPSYLLVSWVKHIAILLDVDFAQALFY
jgi:hypothetical protein